MIERDQKIDIKIFSGSQIIDTLTLPDFLTEEFIKEFLNTDKLKIKLKNKYIILVTWKGLGEYKREAEKLKKSL
jgi:hypothetical protein